MVLTAAHCVCIKGKKRQCRKSVKFTLHDVIPANGSQRRNVPIRGDVYVHPSYDGREERVCLDENVKDIAVIVLDSPVYKFADVEPILVEEAVNIPTEGETLTLVGFGLTGRGVELPDGDRECKNPSLGKMRLRLPVHSIDEKSINFYEKGLYTCGGDSGGPVLNSNSRVVGVSSCGDREYSSSYEPIYPIYDWIFHEERVKHPPSCTTKCERAYDNCMKPDPNVSPREGLLRPNDCKPVQNFCLQGCPSR